MSGQKKRAIPAATAWVFEKIFDKAVENWAPLLAVFAGSGVMTYLAAISSWLKPYGPVAWGGVGLLAILVFALTYLAYALARRHLTISNLIALKASTSRGNILAPVHENERLDLADFYHPGIMKVSGVRFHNCQLFGPLAITMRNCTISAGVFAACEVVIVDEGAGTQNVLLLENCQIFESRLQNLTFFMSAQEWAGYSLEAQRGFPVVAGRQLVGLS